MLARWIAIACLFVMTAGCGSGGIPRYRVSGEATHGGKPIPKGRITFEADRAAGNTGPATTAVIENGRYSTPSDRGAISGPLSVVVYGYDGSPPNEASVFGRQLFPPYVTTIEVDEQATEHTFDVPAN